MKRRYEIVMSFDDLTQANEYLKALDVLLGDRINLSIRKVNPDCIPVAEDLGGSQSKLCEGRPLSEVIA